MARMICITSGKGGVGKTNISVNLALFIARIGYRACLFDADLGLANVNILLGIYPEYTIEDVISGEKQFEEILVQNCQGIDIVPGSSGVEKLANVPNEQLENLIDAFTTLNEYDFVFFDTSAGISKNVISFCMASPEVMLVVTPEPTSLTDGYALLKILSLNGFKGSVSVIVNQISSLEKSQLVFNRFKDAVQKYLPIKILPAGTILKDPHVRDAVTKQKPFISAWPDAKASKCIKNIARYLTQQQLWDRINEPAETFWTRWLELMNGPLILDGVKPKELQTEPLKENSVSRPADEAMVAPLSRVNGRTHHQGPATLDLHRLLGNLDKHLASISDDMSAIRKHIEFKQADL
jgi:flagellar biosynthesis protein FlhG